MMKHTVALVPLNTYDQPDVDEAVRTGVSLLGGMEQFVSKEENILLKPNLLNRALPQKAVTTHPAVFSAVCKLLKESGYEHVSYGDSPGSPTATPEKAAETGGLTAEAQRYGIPAADFNSGSVVRFPEGNRSKSFFLCQAVQDADALISLAKMKTHALQRITGAMKNLYGCIYGINKGAGHAMHPTAETFAEMLCDLHRCVKPRLHILDGVVAMEGNGPSAGVPVNMNVLLFSADPVALDSVFAALVHLDPAAVPTNVYGAKAGLGVMDFKQIDIATPEGILPVEEVVSRFGNPNFDVFRGDIKKKSFTSRVMPLLPFLQHRPKADLEKCIACGICEEACPVPGKAVHSGHGQKAQYDYSKCIRCYCCQEMCPAKAIEVYRHPLARLLSK